MARGLWSWLDEGSAGAAEWARVELEPGEWSDVRRSDYEALGFDPPFLDLPPKEIYLEQVLSNAPSGSG